MTELLNWLQISKKNSKIDEIIDHRKKIFDSESELTKELKNDKYKKSGWIFY